MKKILIMVFLVNTLVLSQTKTVITKVSAITIQEFIPEKYRIFQHVSGDLNKDSLSDEVVVAEPLMGDPNAPMILFILFGQKDGYYHLVFQSDKAAGRKKEIPEENYLTIKRSTFALYFATDERFGESRRFQFRYQDNAWYLIGATLNSAGMMDDNPAGRVFYKNDYNLLTGKLIRTVEPEGGTKSTETIDRGRKTLLKLDLFDPAKVEPDRYF